MLHIGAVLRKLSLLQLFWILADSHEYQAG
jgi:hypothetical protein